MATRTASPRLAAGSACRWGGSSGGSWCVSGCPPLTSRSGGPYRSRVSAGTNGSVLPSGVRLPVAPVMAPPEAGGTDEMTWLGPNGPLTEWEVGPTSPEPGRRVEGRDVTRAAAPQLRPRSAAGRAAMKSGCARCRPPSSRRRQDSSRPDCGPARACEWSTLLTRAPSPGSEAGPQDQSGCRRHPTLTSRPGSGLRVTAALRFQ